MRKWIVIGVVGIALAAVGGLIAVLSKAREPSPEDHLRAYYAAQRNYNVLCGNAWPTLRDKFARQWYKLRGKTEVEYLNEMAKHHSALEDLGYLETREFVVSNRATIYVQSNVWHKAYVTERTNMVVNGLANIWMAAGTNRICVSAPKPDMPKWEKLIREADVAEGGN